MSCKGKYIVLYYNVTTIITKNTGETMLTENKKQLVLDNMSLAEGLAFRRKKSVPPQVSIDELKSAAYLGLVEAAEKYKDGNFSTYAFYRINGAIIDYLRDLGWGSRHKRQSAVSLDLENDEFSIKNLLEAKSSVDSVEVFIEISKDLPEKATTILIEYYCEGQSLKDIANNNSVSEGRICQLMTDYKAHFKQRWEKNEFHAEIAA